METKERLANALKQANAPEYMINKAINGDYDDYESDSATPIFDLVKDCDKNGLSELSEKVKNGHFDGTREESQKWFEKEGKNLI